MSIVFARDTALNADIQSLGSILGLVGTLTFSGSYATGGDVSSDLSAIFRRIGRGRVFYSDTVRGFSLEFNNATKKMLIYSAAGVELLAGAYPAALTASPAGVVIFGR